MGGTAHERVAQARALWAAGDYEAVGARWAGAAIAVVDALDVAGLDVLDVGTGTGEAALAAARAGAATVVGCDPTPELLDVARRRAEREGLDVAWQEGDAQDLPHPDASFDVVVSTFGAMFAPDPPAAAAELVRVTRPGGRVAVTSWTPDGPFRRMSAEAGRLLGAPAGERAPHEWWAEPDLVRQVFAGLPVELDFRVDVVDVRAESPEELIGLLEVSSAPILLARTQLEANGQWPAVRATWLDLFAKAGRDVEGGWALPSPYLVTTARRS